jgi:hypothetical protein
MITATNNNASATGYGWQVKMARTPGEFQIKFANSFLRKAD